MRIEVIELAHQGSKLFVDETGDGSIFYRAQRTERRVRSLSNLVGKSGVIWLRMGSSAWHKGRPSDVMVFAKEAVAWLGGKTVLVTTDGDMSIPSELPRETVDRILEEPNIVAWYTQNYDGSCTHEKLRPLPVGLDLHTSPQGTSINPKRKAGWFRTALACALPIEERLKRIWSDVHFKSNPGRHGDPRGDLREGIFSGRLNELVDVPNSRLSHKEIWARYGQYMFVLSLPGAAVEAHRTWEALALGAIVITVHTSLDELLEPYRVVFLDQQVSEWWRVMADPKWLHDAMISGLRGRLLDLSWEYWNNLVRGPLGAQ